MRLRALAWLFCSVAVAAVPVPAEAAAPAGGVGISVTVSLPGFEVPSAIWNDPCADYDDYAEFVSYRMDGVFRTADASYVQVPADGDAGVFVVGGGDVELVPGEVWAADIPTHVSWFHGCRNKYGQFAPGPTGTSWVPLVTEGTVVPALYKHVPDYLNPPSVSWPSKDPEFGWLYVNAPMDWRIESPDAVELTATVSNITGTVTATVSADPREVIFSPGEPDGGSVLCSVAQATAGYSDAVPGCSYTYEHSSSITGSNEFGTRTVLRWWVTTSASPALLPPHFLSTIEYSSVAVAEVQALECTGEGC